MVKIRLSVLLALRLLACGVLVALVRVQVIDPLLVFNAQVGVVSPEVPDCDLSHLGDELELQELPVVNFGLM